MGTADITLKNYRCFQDKAPATITIGSGFTALLGPNNSGKSAFLRFLYEFPGIWSQIASKPHLLQLLTRGDSELPIGMPRGIADPADIHCDHNDRPIVVELTFPPHPSGYYLESLTFTSRRPVTSEWNVSASFRPHGARPNRVEGDVIVHKSGNIFDYTAPLALGAALSSPLYAPAFRNIINEGSGLHYDVAVGTSLVQQWHAWKTGETRAPKVAIQRLTTEIRDIFGFNTLEINATQDLKSLTAHIDGRPYRLNDIGSGISQFIILFVNAVMRKPSALLIDEPELHLHPSLQLRFLTALAGHTTTRTVCFATHSLGLARSAAERLFAFRASEAGTIVHPLEATRSLPALLGEMSFAALRDIGCEAILLVEGVHDIKTVQQLLRHFRKDQRLVLLPLGGSTMIRAGRDAELAELSRFGVPIYALIDSERTAAGNPVEDSRHAFVASCTQLGFTAHVLERRAIENYFTDRSVKAARGESFAALGHYQSLASSTNGWPKADNWQIAVHSSFDEIIDSDLGQFLNRL